MIDTWWNNFVGIAYRPGGSDEKGCDCWGLVRLVYRRHFGIDLPGVVLDVTPGETPESTAIAPVLDLARDSFWERVSVPQPGDVAVFRVKGHDSHVGLVTTPGYMLHVREGHEAVIEAYDRRFWKNSFRGVYRWKGMEVLKHLSNPDCVTLIGKPSPFAPRITKVLAAGATLADIVNAICDEADIPAPMRKKGVAFVDHEQIPFEQWGDYVPKRGSVVFFRMYPEGSGGFKMVAGIALVVAAVALSVWTGGASLGFAAKFGLMMLSMGLNMAGMFLINSSIQKSAPKPVDVREQKFLNGGNNRIPKYGVIPQVLGIGRMTLDYLAEPYTEQADQYTNYLRAAYTAGYGPVQISDIRNGDTPLGKYRNMEYKVYQGNGDDQKPSIFTKDAREYNINLTLKKGQWNYRQTEDNVDQIQIVLHWPNGMWYRTSAGKKNSKQSAGNIRWRSLPDGKWNELQAYIAPQSFTLQPCAPVIDSTLVYDENGTLDKDNIWLSAYGVPKKLVSEEVEIELYRWHTFAFNTETGDIVVHRGTATDIKGGEPSERLLKILRQSKQLWNSDNVVGRIAPVGDNEELLAYVCVKGDEIIDVLNRRDSVSVEGCDITTDGLTVHFSEGTRTAAGDNGWDFWASNQKRAFSKTYTFKVPRGQYEIGVRLNSADDNDVANWKGSAGLTVAWQTLRTYTNGTPFKPRKPLAWIEMRVKATDQLNGTLDLINAKVASVVLDYDYKKKTWVKRASSNPASLFRHVLQGPAMPAEHAVPDERLDLATLERWHNYCRVNGFTYFKVVGGDTGLNVYDLLVEIAAAGRAKPMLRVESGGLWTVLIDEPKTQVTQLFTEHNSWGWTWTKSCVEPPHAVRATFVDKTKGYEENTVTVYADGYSSANATKYENWGVEFFEGITEVENVQRSVRRALAYAILRSEHLTFYTAQEHLVSEIGDLVMCENSFVQWGLGSGWVEGTIMENGKAVGLRLSSDVTLYPGQEYGIRVRHAAERGASRRYDLKAINVAGQYSEVYFAQPVVKGWPEEGDLFQFGYRERESHQCIIESIKPEADGLAQITVCDYAPELVEIDDIPIPAYQPDISTPQALPSTYISSVPLFDASYSDERALVVEADGSLRCRIGVQWKNPATLERHATTVQVRWAEYGEEGDLGSWMLGEGVPLNEGTAFCSPVEEGALYRVEARYVSDTGVVGPWELMQDFYKVTGSTLPPPDVENLVSTIQDPSGIVLTWDAVDAPDIAHYEVSGDYYAIVNGTTAVFTPQSRIGEVSFAVSAVDRLGHKSEKAATTSIEIFPPVAPVIRSARLLDEGVMVQWQNAKTSWSVDRYDVKSGDNSVSSSGLQAILPIPSPFVLGSNLSVRAKDIFGNWSEVSETTISVYYPKEPNVKIGYDKLTGKITLDWQDCRNDNVGAPTITHYDITGTLTSQQTGNAVSVTGTHYETLVPLTAYEYGTQVDGDGIEVKVATVTVQVTAVDKYGVSTTSKNISLTIRPPYNPTDFGVSATPDKDDEETLDTNWTDGGSVILTWKDCTSTFNISHYDVYDMHTQTSYKVSTNYVVLPARPEGSYQVWVTAYDVLGQSSATMKYNLRIGGVGGINVTAKIDGSDVLLEWDTPSASFAIDHYIVMQDNDTIPTGTNEDANLDGFLGTAKANYFRAPAGLAGDYTYYVWAVDIAGNVNGNFASYAEITVKSPLAPSFIAELAGNGVGMSWTPNYENETLPILAWEVRRYEGRVTADSITDATPVANYGWLDVTATEVPAFEVGTYTFAIRAKDSGGNLGAWAFVDNFIAVAPGPVIINEPVVIDNNVHLYWRTPSTICFPIKEYIVSEVERYDDGTSYEMEIGRADALFISESEEVAGIYTYRITPVDIAGNLGEPADRVCRVAQPPDFVFFDKVDSQFCGGNVKESPNEGRTNFILDGMGHMLGPVVIDETWEDNIARATTEAGKNISTHQQKVDAGFTTWLEPYLASATYVETTNHGTVIPSCNLKVTITSRTIKRDNSVKDSPIFKCKIEIGKLADDGKTINWTVANEDATSVYVSDFQYSRVTITVTHGYVEISNILIDLNIKKLTDFGRNHIEAGDFASTQGTFIPFAVNFVAVQSLPKPRVVGHSDYEAYINFDGSQINPEGFYVYVLDKSGNPKTAEVDWVAYGV